MRIILPTITQIAKTKTLTHTTVAPVGVEKRMDAIEERMDNLEKQFNEFHEDILERIDNLHGSVVILENKVMSEFPALFETFELNKKLQDDRNEKVAYLSKKTEEHSIRISALEGKMKAI